MQTQAIIRENFQRLDILAGHTRHNRMYAAGVIADHSAQGAAAVGRRVRAEGEMVVLGRVAQMIENDARLNTRQSFLRINRENSIHILREVQHDRDIAALPREARAAASREQRDSTKPASCHRCDYVGFILWQHHADRNLPVAGGISRVEGPASFLKAYLAMNSFA